MSGRGIDGNDFGPTRSMMSEEPPVPVDVSGLSGFSYACRPGCGLCCYAEPLVTPAEKPPLLRIVPSAEFVSRGRFEFLGSHSEGGACRLLEGNRCRAHAARPSPCREFPLTAHVGVRLQATVVLTCPGVDLAVLRGYRGPDGASPPRGFETELAALRSRVNRSALRRIEVSERRRRRIARVLTEEGRWNEEEEVRRRLREQIPRPALDDFPAEDAPPLEEGLESLPLVFDGRAGPVAFAGDSGAWELFELRPTGGVARSLGIAAPPDHPPAVTEDAALTLAGYLRVLAGAGRALRNGPSRDAGGRRRVGHGPRRRGAAADRSRDALASARSGGSSAGKRRPPYGRGRARRTPRHGPGPARPCFLGRSALTSARPSKLLARDLLPKTLTAPSSALVLGSAIGRTSVVRAANEGLRAGSPHRHSHRRARPNVGSRPTPGGSGLTSTGRARYRS